MLNIGFQLFVMSQIMVINMPHKIRLSVSAEKI